jgi:hypothetical protein
MPDKNQKKAPGKQKQQQKKNGTDDKDPIDSVLDVGSGSTR